MPYKYLVSFNFRGNNKINLIFVMSAYAKANVSGLETYNQGVCEKHSLETK